MSANTKDLDAWRKKLEKLCNGGMAPFYEKQAIKGALLTQRNVVKTTPVDTGFMRKSWGVDKNVKQEGNTYSTRIFNNARGEASKAYPYGAPYPYYIENGHRIINKKGDTIGYMQGKKILKKAKEKAAGQLAKTAKKDLKAFLEEVMS